MSKRMTKVLSLILTLVMFLSVSTPAFAWGGGDLGSGWDREIGEDEIRDFDEPVVEEEETLDYFHAIDEDSLLEVTVEAPMGALPTLAELRAEPVEVEDVREAVESVVEGKANILVAMDISFWMNGVEIEPEEPVNVKISAPELADKSNLTLVHIPDAAEPETIDLIDEGDLGFALGTTEIAFKANSFSVYAIVAGDDTPADDQPYRTTYEFYNADGSKYYFKDAAGRDQYTQILKDGEKLEDVGIPTVGASSNAKFVGWYDDNGNKVEVGENKTVTANTTIRLTAKMQGIVNVYFVSAVMEGEGGEGGSSEGGGRSIVIVKQVEFTVGQSEPITVDTADVTTDAPKAEQAVVGWNRDETAANAGTAEGTGDNKTITLFTNTDDIHDVTLFPAIKDAYWLFFDENDGGTGGGASYTPPQFVMIGAKPTKPADPHRTGYTFGGWYKDADCTQAFSFDEPLDQTRRVYAKWVGAATTYTIIVWEQRTSDSASITSSSNLSNDDKTYDFYRTYTVNSTTGAQATATNASMSLGNTLDADGHIKYNRNDGPKTVEADGSTVINVYYDRDVMTIHFRNSQYDYYDSYDTWYGLYDATFAESNKTWPVINNRQWQSSSYTYTFMDAFVDFDTRTATSLTLWQVTAASSYYDYVFQKETLTTGQFVTANSSERDASLTLSEKYKGFTLYRYRNGTSGNWTYTNGTYPSVPNAYS
ncbi:MAG: InlB B-repeat-containing protein, partial [Oscillospiraceae bacterium]|nr:InlB B-repeat-containing protein [Oscillospiraceae bacterium]